MNGRTDRQAKRQRDRHSDIRTDRWINRPMDRQTDGQTERWTDRQKDGKRDRWTDRQTDRWTYRQTDRQGIHSSIQTGRQLTDSPMSINLLMYQSFCLSSCSSVQLSLHLSMCLSVNHSVYLFVSLFVCISVQGILKGEYHCAVDLLFDGFGLVCFANKNKKMSVVIQLIPNLSNRRSMVQ